MTSYAATSVGDPSDLVTILETFPALAGRVYIGPVPPGQPTLPAVACWPVEPARTGEALAQEDGGQVHDIWQLTVVGATVGQAKTTRDRIMNGAVTWPIGWELDVIGPTFIDADPAPVGWLAPVRYKHTRVV